MIVKKTTSQAYQAMLKQVLNKPQFESSPRGMNTREILNFSIEVKEPSPVPIVTGDRSRNKIIANYTAKEFDWYLSGCRKAEKAPAKFWQTIADEDGNVNSNYGHVVLYDESEDGKTPFRWALHSLYEDKDSRKAIMRFNKPEHCINGDKDFVCTMYMIFHIRDDKLYATARMRSADLFTGPVYDIPFFCFLQQKIFNSLKIMYHDLEMGSMTFSADSLHIYEKNFEQVKRMIK